MTTTHRELSAADLRRTGESQALDFECTEDLPALTEIIGQERATRAIEFGLEIPAYGYNVYAMGPAGAGKTSTIMRYLQQKAQTRKVPPDWGYVNCFTDIQAPNALRLPAGGGRAFQSAVNDLLEAIADQFPKAFASEQYEEHRQRLSRELDENRRAEFREMEAFAAERGFAVGRTPMGLMIAPLVEGKVLSREQYMELPEEQRNALGEKEPEVQEKLQATLRRVRELEQGVKGRLGNLDQEVAASVLAPLFKPLREDYSDWPEVVEFLEAVESDIVDRTDRIRAALGDTGEEGADEEPAWMAAQAGSPLDRYRVNVIVDHSGSDGAPVVLETNPTYYNVMGRMERRAQFGTLVTDFHMIRGGALHRANGGYLVLDARALLRQPLAWEALKRSLRHHETRIEDVGQQMGLIPTTTLTPEPIPLEIKVVLIGDAETYYLMYAMDDQFQKLFKVRADFAVEMTWNDENAEQLARFIRSRCESAGLPHFGPQAVARVLQFSARQVEDQQKLTTRFAHIADLISESAFWAKERR